MPTYSLPTADAIVVGAGPAGSATALLLARRGASVLLLDRQAFPRPKPCGDCLSAAATRVLDRLGVLDPVLATGPARLDGWTIASPGGHRFTGRFGPAVDDPADADDARDDAPGRTCGTDRSLPSTALAVERAVLDRVLHRAALDAGARFRQVHVTGLLRDGGPAREAGARGTTGEPETERRGAVVGVEGREDGAPVSVRSRLVVGADGLRSVVATRLGALRRPPRLRKVSLTTHVTSTTPLTADPRLGEMHLADGACLGVAPVDAGATRWNLTLVVDQDRAGRLKEEGPDAFFRGWLSRFPTVRFAIRSADTGPFLASGPFDRPVRTPVADGVALVGDAAGYYDPFTGQGIYRALAGAEALADAVGPMLDPAGRAPAEAPDAPALGAPDPARPDPEPVPARHLEPYVRARRRMLAGPVRLQKLIEAVLSRPRLADALIPRLSGPLGDRLVAVTGDLLPPVSLLDPRLLLDVILPGEVAP